MLKKQKILSVVLAIAMVLTSVFVGLPAFATGEDAAAEAPSEESCATFLSDYCPEGNKDMFDLLRLVIGIMTAGVIVAGTIGVIICGYTVLTARDNADKIKEAKNRIFEIVIGLVLWVLAAAIIHFLLPSADTSMLSIVTPILGGNI